MNRISPYGVSIETYAADITNHNVLEVEAGTTGITGGKPLNGGAATYFRIEDAACTFMDVKSYEKPLGIKGFEVFLHGDAELYTIIQALEFITDVLKGEAQLYKEGRYE